MPKIQQYQSQGEFKPSQPSQIDEGLFTSGAKQIGQTAQTLDAITQKFAELKNTQQTTEALTNMKMKLDNIETNANSDQDIYSSQKYHAEVNQAVSESLTKISDPAARAKAAQTFQLSGMDSIGKINNTFRKRQVEVAQNNLYSALSVMEDHYIDAATPQQKEVQVVTAHNTLDQYVSTGILTAEQAQAFKKSIAKDWPRREFLKDVQDNATMASQRLTNGQYAGLDTPEERYWAQNLADTNIRKQKEQVEYADKTAKISNEFNIIKGLAEGNFDKNNISEISKQITAGNIRQEFGEAAIKYFSSPESVDPAGDDNKEAFATMVEQIFESGDKENVSKALIGVLNGGADGRISKDDFGLLIRAATQRGGELTVLQGIKTSLTAGYKAGSPGAELALNFERLKEWNTQSKNGLAGHTFKDFLLNVDAGLKPNEAADAAIKSSIVRLYPSMAGQKEMPNMVIDENSPVRVVFPRETKIYPNRIWDAGAKRFVNNTNREQSSGGKEE